MVTHHTLTAILLVVISIHTTAKVVTKNHLNGTRHDIISIHTTAKVVTGSLYFIPLSRSISIHTTAKVVTFLRAVLDVLYSDFNPHHREGGDKSHEKL